MALTQSIGKLAEQDPDGLKEYDMGLMAEVATVLMQEAYNASMVWERRTRQMAKKINSDMNINDLDELSQDIRFCAGVTAVMQMLAGATVGDHSALAEVAHLEPGGLSEILDQAWEKMKRIEKITEKISLARTIEKAA